MEHVHHRSQNGGPHVATLFAIATIVLGIAVSLVAFFAKADRDDIKASAALAIVRTNAHDTEIALLKQSLARLEADTAELKKGQNEILARLPAKR